MTWSSARACRVSTIADVISKLGPLELSRAMASYLAAALRPNGPQETFEQWVSKRFGRRLYEMFFAA
jgi:hypothetical protein